MRIVNDMKNDCGLLRISVASCWHYMSESRNSQCVTAHTFMSTKTSVQRGQKYLGLRQCGISNVSMSGIVSLMLLLKNLMFTSLCVCVCVLHSLCLCCFSVYPSDREDDFSTWVARVLQTWTLYARGLWIPAITY